MYQKYFADLRIITIFAASYPKRKWSYSQNLNFKIRDNTRQNMSTGILGWLFGKDPNKAFNKGVEKVANHHSHKSFGQLFEEATEESYVCKLKY